MYIVTYGGKQDMACFPCYLGKNEKYFSIMFSQWKMFVIC